MSQMETRNEPENDRYVIEVDGVVAGFTVYHVRGGRYFFVHTQIEPSFTGQGLGSVLARYALDDVRAKGGTIIPICPFIAGYVDRHPEYQSLIDEQLWDRINSRLKPQ